MPFPHRKSSSRKPPKGNSEFLPPALRAATFAEAWDEARTRYTPEDPVNPPQLAVNVAKPVVDWVRQGVRPQERGFTEGDVYANALMLGAFCLIAGHRGEHPILLTPNRRVAELPLMSDYRMDAANSTYRIKVPPMAFSVDTWVRFDGGHADWTMPGGGGPKTEHLVHAGVHILGAMTLLPERSAVAVIPHDSGPTRYYRPPLNLAGAPPFPHDVSVPTLPFIPPAPRQ